MRPCPSLKRRGTENSSGSIVPGAGKSVVTMVALARMRTSGTIRFGGCHRRARERNVLEIVPMTLREANAFVEQNHRHHGATVGHMSGIYNKNADLAVKTGFQHLVNRLPVDSGAFHGNVPTFGFDDPVP